MHFGVHALPQVVCGDARGIYVKRAESLEEAADAIAVHRLFSHVCCGLGYT